MSVKAKTKKRLGLLLAAVVGVGLLGGAAFLYRQHHRNVWLKNERALGMKADADNDALAALQHLGNWLSRNPDDIEVLRPYAKNRLLVETSDSSYVKDAIAAYRRIVSLSPDAVESRRELMHLYARYGFETEALDAENILINKNHADLDALQSKAATLMRLRRWDEARKATADWAKADPNNAEAQMQILGLMAQMEQPATEILKQAQSVTAKNPNTPQSQLIMGIAYELTQQVDPAREMLRKAADQPSPTPEFSKLMVDQLNRAGMYADSLKLLTKQEQSGDTTARQALLRRMWEMNRAKDVIALTDKDPATLGIEGMALRALSLAQLGKPDDAKKILGSLQGRQNDPLAKAWSAILSQELHIASIDPRKMLELCQHAIFHDSQGGYLRYFMGQAYAQLDEGELAIDLWQNLARQNPTWSLPLIRLSEMRLAKGRDALAMQAAQFAVQRSPESALAAINLAKVWSANVESGHADRPDELLKLIAQIRTALPQEEQTLTMQVSLLGSLHKNDQAAAEIKKALALKNPLSEQALLHLAVASRIYNLGLTEQCFDRSEAAHGLTANLAYARAMDKFSNGAPADGLALLKSAREKAPQAGQSLDWQMAWARYLEVIQDPAAKDAWEKLADANPSDRQIQQIVLSVHSTQADRDFLDKSIDRLKKLTGEEGVTWKIARARWILGDAKSDQTLLQVTTLLQSVIRTAPDMVEPHILLANAYERLNNSNQAVEELRTASVADPNNTQVALKLSQFLQKRGEFDKAKEVLDRAAQNKGANEDQKRQMAMLLAQQGDSKKAIEVLQPGSDDKGGTGDSLLLAMLYRQRNQPAKAEEIVKKLLEKPDPVTVQFAADLYAQQGRRADADHALALLDTMQLKPGLKELLLADHATRYQGPERAISMFQAALKAAPDNAAAWKALIGYYAYLGKGKELASTAEAGASAAPTDASLKEIAAQKDLLAESAENSEARPLVLAYLSDARPDSPALQGLTTIASANHNKEFPAQTIAKLKKLVDANPTYSPLQAVLIERYLQHNQKDEAQQLAARGVEMFPNDADAARLAVEALTSSQRWTEALGFAKIWRERTLSNPMRADMAISACLMQLGQPAQAEAAIAPYIPAAVTDPEHGGNVIVQYASTLMLSGQADKAAELLWPLASQSPSWRRAWMDGALLLPTPTASAWLDRIATILPADADQDHTLLAETWHTLAVKSKDPQVMAKANAMFDTLMAQPNLKASTALARGMAAEQDGDFKTAESAYHKALLLDPNAIAADNNLAMLIVKQGGDLNEATRLAKAAIAKQPNVATLHDTLALVQAKSKDIDGAVASLQHAQNLEPNSIEWRVHLIRVLLDGGRRPDATKAWKDLQSLPTDLPMSDQTRTQLAQLKVDMSKQSSITTP
ncbi:MAG TPA: tetratricopeptide repeat protein [Tepidisphaeraceae bacterium]|jgi:predicted Zn-dependent protease|nr:tetratricopeptide repeat protein [Tepidisphaeraceae bacterium]